MRTRTIRVRNTPSSVGAVPSPTAPSLFVQLIPIINPYDLPRPKADNLFNPDPSLYCASDADEQLIIKIPFRETCRIRSINFIGATGENRPTVVKIFANANQAMDFDEASDTRATQELKLTDADMDKDKSTPLRFVHFQRVRSLTIFIEDNAGGDITTLSNIEIYGSTINGIVVPEDGLKSC